MKGTIVGFGFEDKSVDFSIAGNTKKLYAKTDHFKILCDRLYDALVLTKDIKAAKNYMEVELDIDGLIITNFSFIDEIPAKTEKES
jgi:hypothetical protein